MLFERFVPQEKIGLERALLMKKMNLHVDLFLIDDNFNGFHGQGQLSINYGEVIIDPSFLFYLSSHKIKESEVNYYLPDNLLRLINGSEENAEYRQFLKSFLSFFRYGFSRKFNDDDWYLFYDNIQKMNIKPITQEMVKPEQNNDYYSDYLQFFQDHEFYLSMSPTINFLGDCIAKIMEFSRRTGILILSKSRKLANLLREKIVSILLLPIF
ncbi:MAG: hypothetical protein M0Q51_01510 [Bacteroidales bacterium]|nr:hypothetical protein [Bacteroidales bacterium]